VPPATTLEEIIEEEATVEVVPEQEDPKVQEVIFADAEPELPQPRFFNMIMRDYVESPLMMANGPLSWMIWTTWMTQPRLTMTWMSGSPRMKAMIRIESSSLSL
jgi:hypothetical protein